MKNLERWLTVLLISLQLNSVTADVQLIEAADEERIELDPLVIVASKSPRPMSEVAAQVTVIDADSMRKTLVEDLDGLLRYEPGLDLETAGTRFGSTGINIRGIGGNRVYIEQDGIPIRDRYVVGSFSDGGRTLVETDRIKRVEVLHGPASVMYGSNALGGVVAITTWDPSDLLLRQDQPVAASTRAGYQGANDSVFGTFTGALVHDAHGLMLSATYREGHELDNQAPPDIPADSQDWTSRDVLLRYTYDTATGNRWRLSAAGLTRDADTQLESQLGYGRRFRTTTSLEGRDEDKSERLSLDYDFSWAGWQQGIVRIFSTRYTTDQLTLETRGSAPVPVSLERQFFYRQEHLGADFSLFRVFDRAGWRHRLGWGAEWLRTRSSELRNGLQTVLDTGQTTNTILGETFPVRDFPTSTNVQLSLFVQDEISLGDGDWELIPAIRWDRHELEPEPDSIWLEDFPGMEVVSVTESELTPRLGALWHFNEEWSLYGQYARGFRAPPFEDANIGLDIPLFGIRAIPNPDLESETSDGFEVGLRLFDQHSRFSLAVFDTDYDKFIETRALVGVDPATGDLLFQSRNIDQARIYGFDIRFDQELVAWHPRLSGWLLRFAAYWSEGENCESGQPLNSISPPQAVVGLSWDSPDESWNVGISSTLTAARSAGDIDQTDGARFATPGWGTIDVVAGWSPSARLELRVGIFNLGDKTYWRWLDVASLDAGNPMIPLLSRPGRNVSFSASLKF